MALNQRERRIEKVTCVSCGEQMTQPEAHVEKAMRRPSEQVIGIFQARVSDENYKALNYELIVCWWWLYTSGRAIIRLFFI